MTGPATTVSTSTVAVLSLANIMGSELFGISVDRIGAALLITVFGVFGRLGWEIYSDVKTSGSVRWPRVFGLSAAGLISALSITILVLALLKVLGTVNDNATIICLLFFGFIGPDALPWLFNLATSTIKKRTGMDFPGLPPSAEGKP